MSFQGIGYRLGDGREERQERQAPLRNMNIRSIDETRLVESHLVEILSDESGLSDSFDESDISSEEYDYMPHLEPVQTILDIPLQFRFNNNMSGYVHPIQFSLRSWEDLISGQELPRNLNTDLEAAMAESRDMYKYVEKKDVNVLLECVIFSEEVNNNSYADACSICQSDFELEESVGLLKCKHLFHKECIVEWCKYKNECPNCKEIIPLV